MGEEDVTSEGTFSDTEKNSETGTQPVVNEQQCNSRLDYVRSKMETMQKRIDELKERIEFEGDVLQREEATLKSDILEDNVVDLQTLFEEKGQESDGSSEQSLYFSASNNSLCSLSTRSTDSAFSTFTKFVNNFVKNQSPQERTSLLQLHSKKQISLNMMKHSLAELDSRCSDELEIIARNLEHLDRLAAEFNVDTGHTRGDGQPKALEFHDRNEDSRKRKARSNLTFIWPPFNAGPEKQFEWNRSPAFIKCDVENSSTDK